MPPLDIAAVVHQRGLVTGCAHRALLGAMVVHRAGVGSHPAADAARDRPVLATAVPGRRRNAGASVARREPDLDVAAIRAGIEALADAALGFPPAAVVHAATGGVGGAGLAVRAVPDGCTSADAWLPSDRRTRAGSWR